MRLPSTPKRRSAMRRWTLPGIAMALFLLGSCTNLGYYSHSVWGGAKVLSRRKSVARLIADEGTPSQLRDRLALALEMRAFAVSELHLPENSSYSKYADLNRQYAMWNVVAAPELSISPETWCFLFAGCVSYRGYFSEERAQRFAKKMHGRGYDVDVGGVAAYSTIGWFADPLLSTFIERPEPHLAGLLFHELAHQQVYIKGDTTFNESFAMAVEEEGALRWLASRGLHDQMESYRLLKGWEKQFSELVLSYRERLAEAYGAEESDDWKRHRKAEILESLRRDYDELKNDWGGYSGFDGWFDRDLNNARLALIGAYHQLVPSFLALLERHQGRLDTFYLEVEEISRVPAEDRRRRLEAALAEDLDRGAAG